VLLLTCACNGSRPTKSEVFASVPAPAKSSAATTSAAVPASAAAVPAKRELTAELEQLIAVSKAKLSPQEKRMRLQAALEKFPEHSRQRESLIVSAVTGGALDPPEWTTVISNYQGRRAEIQVTKDALTILGVRFDVTAEGAQRIADQLHAVLLTPRVLQLIWEQADVRLEPCTLPADAAIASTARMIEHSKCVDQRIAGRKGLIVNVGKHWVLTNRITAKKYLAANYGWFQKGHRPIQEVGTRHDTAHTDYSQVLRLMKPTIRVDGREVDIRRVGRSPDLWGLVSDEGPLLVWRAIRSAVAPTQDDSAVLTAPLPAPGDPKAVRLTLKRGELPIGIEQLPEATTALRRTTVQRRLLKSLRLRTEDVPEEAYWSAAAAACGGRDIFFELLNHVDIDLAELARSRAAIQQGLTCGKALAPQVHAGIGVYQLEYDHDSTPSGLALLAVPDDSFQNQLLYPPLSPTPAGVHRAYCNDDEGGPRSVCQDGERSRLIVAVNSGYLAAYAHELPSLLERFTSSQPAPAPKLAELAAFFLEPTPAEEVAVAQGGSCAFALDFTAWAFSGDESSRQRALDAVNDNAVLCGTQAWGSVLNLSRKLTFIAKNRTAALVVAAALKRRAFEASRQVPTAISRVEAQKAFDEARYSAEARALRDAKLESEGTRVTFMVNVQPNAAELRAMSELLDERRATAQQAAAVVRVLAEGKLPSDEQISPLMTPAADGMAANP